MPEDLKKKEEEKEEEQKQEERKSGWFSRTPVIYKVLGAFALILKYQSISANGGNIQELWLWAGIILLILYFLGSEVKKVDPGVLTPKEAREALDREIGMLRDEGKFDPRAKISTGPVMGMFRFEGMPKHYVAEVQVLDEMGRHYMKGIIDAVGETKGFVTFTDSIGKYSGLEPLIKVTPKAFNDLNKKYGLDWKDIMFGRGR